MQVKYSLNVNSLEVIWSRDYLIQFFIFSSKQASQETRIQVCFCILACENGKKLLTVIFFKLSKKNLPYGCFHILATFQKYMPQQKEENHNNITRNSSRSDILTLLTLQTADAKSAVLLRVPSLNKVKVRNFPLLHFSK